MTVLKRVEVNLRVVVEVVGRPKALVVVMMLIDVLVKLDVAKARVVEVTVVREVLVVALWTVTVAFLAVLVVEEVVFAEAAEMSADVVVELVVVFKAWAEIEAEELLVVNNVDVVFNDEVRVAVVADVVAML